MGDHEAETESPKPAASVWHIEVDQRRLPSRVLRTSVTLVLALLTEGGATSPSNRIWRIVETATGRVLTTVKHGYGDETDTGAQLASELETYSPAEFATRWGFAADI